MATTPRGKEGGEKMNENSAAKTCTHVWIKRYAHGIGAVIREVRMPLLLLLVVVMVVVVVLFVI